MYLPLAAGISSYILSYAMLWYFTKQASSLSGESIGPGILFINCFYVYVIGLMLCLFTAVVKKSVKMALFVFLLPLFIFLATMHYYKMTSGRINYPAPLEDFLL